MSAELMVLIGPPGAGKSTLCVRWAASRRVSLDQFREMCADTPLDMTATVHAVAMREIVLAERMRRGLQTVCDSTNTVAVHRLALLKVARDWSRPTVGVLFHTPLQVCLQRQLDRPAGEQVPARVVERMFADLVDRWDTLAREVDCVVHVSPDGKQLLRVGDVPAPPGEHPQWLEEIPVVPGTSHLPWEVPYAVHVR